MNHDELHQLAQRLRIDSIRAAAAAYSGHPTSSMSAADLMAVLMGKYLRYDYDQPENPNNDHLIFSKGHASPLVYAMFRAAGAITDEELLTFRQFGSRLEGHPTPVLPWVDVATGSLGQGLPISTGIALCARDARSPALPRVVPVWRLRDGRGVDLGGGRSRRRGRAGQPRRDHRRQSPRVSAARRCTAGTSTPTPDAPRPAAGTRSRSTVTTWPRSTAPTPRRRRPPASPTMVIARTIKGYGATETANVEGKHGQPLKDPEKAIHELGDVPPIHVDVAKPESPRNPPQVRRRPLRPAAALRARTATRCRRARPSARVSPRSCAAAAT